MTVSVTSSSIRCALGEGPLWHPRLQQLYVTDVFARKIHVFDSDLTCIRTISCERITTAMTWEEDGSILLFHDRGAISRLRSDDSIRLVFNGLSDEKNGTFNDVIADPAGRILAGTQPVGNRLGRLYAIDRNFQSKILLNDVQEPNGLGFSIDHKQLFFSDSGRRSVSAFDFDVADCSISNRRCLYQGNDNLVPDGLTVDQQDNVWIALWDGAQIICLTPDGDILQSIPLPAQRTSSLTFGGSNFRSIFVTSASDGVPINKCSELEGAVFRLDESGAGLAEFPTRTNRF
ncbi:MAG: SMP-30/gluconolactonase/LRE family protein [Xanthomonadales bacterium]|nr:SMP-30/gluconolactonase/LRE family protein [Xanthomonadales bacterium]